MKIANVIHQVNLTENVAIVSFEKAPVKISFVSALFDYVAKAGINVDMISQTTPKGDSNTISFTVSDDKVADMLALITSLNNDKRAVMPLISAGNVKIALYGPEMPNLVGVASDVFDRLNEVGVDVLLITTSDVDISIVVSRANAELAYQTLREAYLGK